jgi:DNA-directed RNA polymerase specialized sigma24 family protein
MTAAELFAALYLAHSARVRRVILAELRPGDRDQADDLAQDVWLAFWRRLDRGDVLRNVPGLLAVMARHRVVDHYRRAYVRRELPTDTTTYGAFDQAAARELVTA